MSLAIPKHTSEILLVAVLLVMVGFVRVYVGGEAGPMVVWKGEFGYKDTIVNLSDFYKMPKNVAVAEHGTVVYQLEEMGMATPDH